WRLEPTFGLECAADDDRWRFLRFLRRLFSLIHLPHHHDLPLVTITLFFDNHRLAELHRVGSQAELLEMLLRCVPAVAELSQSLVDVFPSGQEIYLDPQILRLPLEFDNSVACHRAPRPR